MKLSAVLLVGASLVAAQKAVDYFPECAIDCLTDSVSAASDCDFDDAWCICVQATYEEITMHGTACILLECGPDVALGEVLPAAVPYCDAATSSHENGAKATASKSADSSPSATTTSDSAAKTTDASTSTETDGADAPEASGDADEEDGDDESAAAKAAPALLAMLALGAAAAF